MGWYREFAPYVPVGQRIANARREMAKLQKKGHAVSPVIIEGRKISETFWGKSWCENLERYSDMANRLPRGRSYVRNGSVVDLKIEPGRVAARVAGSSLYTVNVQIKPLPAKAWKTISGRCAGQIASIIELLSGKLSKAVMEIITHPTDGLFPKPAEIEMDCSCPDGAYMCKHIAAVLYGIGRRLDDRPDLLFVLRKVDHLALIQHAGDVAGATESTTGAKTLEAGELEDVFGISLESAPVAAEKTAPAKKAPVKKKAVGRVTAGAKRAGRKAVKKVKKKGSGKR